jgi:hypothetical protein
MEQIKNCSTCDFWEVDDKLAEGATEMEGECRVEHPRVFMVLQPDKFDQRMMFPANVTMFPRTRKSRGCGEHKFRKS